MNGRKTGGQPLVVGGMCKMKRHRINSEADIVHKGGGNKCRERLRVRRRREYSSSSAVSLAKNALIENHYAEYNELVAHFKERGAA